MAFTTLSLDDFSIQTKDFKRNVNGHMPIAMHVHIEKTYSVIILNHFRFKPIYAEEKFAQVLNAEEKWKISNYIIGMSELLIQVIFLSNEAKYVE